MHTRIMHTASELIGELDKNLPLEAWRQVLHVFVPTHIADRLQIQHYVGLDHDKFRRVMDTLQIYQVDLLNYTIRREAKVGVRWKL